MANVTRSYPVQTTLTAAQVCQLINNGQVNNLPIQIPGLAAGSSVAPNSVVAINTSATQLTSTSVLVSYRNNTTTYLNAVVLIVSGTTITTGTAIQLNSVITGYNSAVTLSPTSVFLAYEDATDAALYGVVLTISGTTIVSGALTLINNSSAPLGVYAVMLSSTSVLVFMSTSAVNYAYAVVVTITGSTFVSGTFTNVYAVLSSSTVAVALSPTSVLVAYQNGSSTNNYLYAGILTLSGTNNATIASGTNTPINAFNSLMITCTALSSTSVLIAYQNNTNSNYLNAIVVTIAGSTITPGSNIVLNAVGSHYTFALTLSSTSAIVVYEPYGGTGYLTAMILGVSGTTITTGTVSAINSVVSTYVSAALLSSNSILVTYTNGTSTYLNAVAINTLTNKPLGVALNTTGTVQLQGIVHGIFSSLVPGCNYYFDVNGAITTNSAGTYLGVALNPTDLLILNYILS